MMWIVYFMMLSDDTMLIALPVWDGVQPSR